MEPDSELNAPLICCEKEVSEIAEKQCMTGMKEEMSRGKVQVNQNEIGIESLDYEPIHSIVYARTRKTPQTRHIYGYTGLTFAKWTITILIGFLVGCVAYIITFAQELIINKKKNWTQDFISHGLAKAFLGYAASSIMLVIMSSCLVLYWAPAAAGGGVTLVMAYLNGSAIPDLLRLKTLITKIFGTICTISSGLPIGQEGPLVHIGAAVASVLTWMHGDFPTNKIKRSRHCCKDIFPKAFPYDFYNDRDRREFITAGTAAGMAAAFGSPIGGVLYSFEEASSFWSRKVMWRSLICATVATMVLSWLYERHFSFALPGSLSFNGIKPEFKFRDIPFFAITSIGAGILGALVNIFHRWLSHIRPPSTHTISRLVEVCLVTLISVFVTFFFSHMFGECLEVPEGESEEFWFAYTCPQEESSRNYNDLATLYFSVPHQTIRHLLQLGSEPVSLFSVKSLGIHWGSFLILFILAYGIATPGGIFMPSMMVGASYGAFVGTLFKSLFPGEKIQPGLHALVGATSMLGGLFRSTVSLVVIIVEGTGGIDFILPIIVAIVVSNWVAHHIHHAGAYEADLEHSGNLHFLQGEPPHSLISLAAADIMAPDIVGFEEIVTIKEVVNVLRERRHNGFPVYKRSIDSEEGEGSRRSSGKMVGFILRHQLLWLLEQHAFIELNALNFQSLRQNTSNIAGSKKGLQELQFLEHGMVVYHHCHYPHRRDLASRPEALDAFELDRILHSTTTLANDDEYTSEEISDTTVGKVLALDLRPFMNRAPITVRSECSGHRVYAIFRNLGLRHLTVTDSNNKVVGMITRKDITYAIKESKFLEQKGTLVRWDSDMQSFYGGYETTSDKDKLYNLP